MPATSGVDRDDRVPAHEGRCQGGPARRPGDGRGRCEHADCGQPLEDPRCCVRRRSRESGDGLRGERERRSVDARRVAPVGAGMPGRRALREGRRRVDVRVPASLGRDPAVAPVRPRVGGEHERRCQRQGLHGDGGEQGEAQREAATPHEQEAGDVRAERGCEQNEERPCRALLGKPSIPRDERGAVAPRERGRETDEGRCRAPGGERRPGAHGSAGRPPFVEGPAAPEPAAAVAAGGFEVVVAFAAGVASTGFGEVVSSVVVGAGADGAT